MVDAKTASARFETAQQDFFEEVGLTATTRFIDLETPPIRTHVIESGPQDNREPLVFVHGTAAFGAFLAPLMAQFPGTRTIAFDRPGYGLSAPFEYNADNLHRTNVEVIKGVLDALDLDQVHLVGHSMGGHASIRFALERPERVQQITTLGAMPGFPGTHLPLPFRLMTVPLLNRLIQRLQPSGEEGALEIAEILGERAAFEAHPSFVRANAANDADPKAAKAGQSEIIAISTIRGWRPSFPIRSEELRELRHPTLLIWGADDPIGKPADVRDSVRSITQARFETLGSGHLPYLAQPAKCAELIREANSMGSANAA